MKRRTKAWIAGPLLLAAGLVALGLWWHDSTLEEAGRLCRASRRAPTMRQRAQLLDQAEPLRKRLRMLFDSSVYCTLADGDMKQLLYQKSKGRLVVGASRRSPGADLATRSLGGSGPWTRGACVQYPLAEVPCVCQGANFPEAWKGTGLVECASEGLRTARE